MCLSSRSPARGIVRSCTAPKTSELSVFGALFSQDHYTCKGGFLHFFTLPLPAIITGHALCGEHELEEGAGRVVLESS